MRIVFSDLDGTLLTYHKTVHPLCIEALSRFAEKGGVFVPCTGRPRSALDASVTELPGAAYAVCANGATVYDLATEACIHRIDLGLERTLALYERVRDLDVTFDIMADGAAYAETWRFERMLTKGYDPAFIAHIRRSRIRYDVPVEEMAASFAHIERISIYWKDERDRDAVAAAVAEDSTLVCTTSEPFSMEISDKEATKGNALTWLCGFLGIDVAESVAFGDGLNDSTMLEAAGTGVAMLNASEGVERFADTRTRLDNDEGGEGDWILRHLEG
jgi:Cof subfamily protein (haloacid dehalogenase superfamily)